MVQDEGSREGQSLGNQGAIPLYELEEVQEREGDVVFSWVM